VIERIISFIFDVSGVTRLHYSPLLRLWETR